MQKYDDPTATIDGEFTDGNPELNEGRTVLKAKWPNMMQREGVNLVEGSGLALNGAAFDQWLQAVFKIGGQGASTLVSASATLTPAQRGVVLIDAGAGDVTLVLPPANSPMDYWFLRIDGTSNRAIVACSGVDKIIHNSHVQPFGYGFIRLFGVGDYWLLRSSLGGGWLPLQRRDPAPVGSILTYTGYNVLPPGGYMVADGTAILRAEFPWIWDFAIANGVTVPQAEWPVNKQGAYSTGDLVTNLRIPDLRGEFVRGLDTGAGRDPGRGPGWWQGDMFEAHSHSTTAVQAVNPAYIDGGNDYGQGPSNSGVIGGSETRPRNVAYPFLLKII